MECKNKDISDKLLLYLEEELPDDQYRQLGEHLQSCPVCKAELENLTQITATIQVAAGHIKEKWVHPTPEELVSYQSDPESLESVRRNEIEAHLSLCPGCAREMEMLREVPREQGDAPDDVVMPEKLKHAFARQYPHKTVTSPHKTREGAPGGFWQWLSGLLARPTHLAYATAVVMVAIIAVFIFGSNQGAPPEQGVVYVRYDPAGISTDRLARFQQFLSGNGIPSRMEDGRLLIDPERRNLADLALARFVRGEVVARDGRPGGWPSPDGVDPDDPNDFFYRLDKNSKLLVVDARGNFPRSAPVSVYGRQPIISAFSVLEDRESDIILARVSKNRNRSIIGADMEEREKATSRVQEEFRKKAAAALKSHPKVAGSPVKVYVTLSFQKDDKDEYQVQSYTVIIEDASELTSDEKERVSSDVRKALGAKQKWDEDFLFLER